MSIHPRTVYSIPEETQRVARAAFPKGTLCLRIADALGSIYEDSQFAELFPRRGQAVEAPARLALATVLQFVEGLSDRRRMTVPPVSGDGNEKCAILNKPEKWLPFKQFTNLQPPLDIFHGGSRGDHPPGEFAFDIGLASWHVLDVPCIDHHDFDAPRLQHFRRAASSRCRWTPSPPS